MEINDKIKVENYYFSISYYIYKLNERNLPTTEQDV